MKSKYADAQGNLHWQYSFYSGLLSGIPSALIVVKYLYNLDPIRSRSIQSYFK